MLPLAYALVPAHTDEREAAEALMFSPLSRSNLNLFSPYIRRLMFSGSLLIPISHHQYSDDSDFIPSSWHGFFFGSR